MKSLLVSAVFQSSVGWACFGGFLGLGKHGDWDPLLGVAGLLNIAIGLGFAISAYRCST